MSICLACAEWTPVRPLCRGCSAELTASPRRRLASGLLVAGGLSHRGAARRLVHRLKYQGVVEAGAVLAAFMQPLLPASAAVLVPLPRARLRRLRFGIDPALALARLLSKSSGLPVHTALVSSLWWPRYAMRARDGRSPPAFSTVGHVGRGAVLIDDVCTSGATLEAANRALGGGFRHGVVATAPRMNLPAHT